MTAALSADGRYFTGPLRTEGHDLTTYDALGEPRRFDLDQSYRSCNGLVPSQGVAFAVSL